MLSDDTNVRQVALATRHWVQVFAQADPDRMAALYLPDAVLWGTFATRLIQGRPGIRQYFERAFAPGVPPRAELGEHLARAYGELAVCTGHYSFTLSLQGAPRTLPARFSFTFRKVGAHWLIADHHSSLIPADA